MAACGTHITPWYRLSSDERSVAVAEAASSGEALHDTTIPGIGTRAYASPNAWQWNKHTKLTGGIPDYQVFAAGAAALPLRAAS
ncbi:hypothetical protein ACF1AB_36165 [Streptomyces sp. NPDC014846]|uniref:hypothetical protein n=1 Tax=Streptomyces sp. NPDC014846 TaxID=3364922 RepID=UPI0036FCD796